MDANELKQIDLNNLWHPFTQASTWLEESDPLIINSAHGVHLIDVNGKRYLDGVSSLWCNVHGHAVPELVNVLQKQAALLCHSTLLGITHRPILELTKQLLTMVPENLNKVFYSDSGSAAVEAGLRMALEWWQKSGPSAGKKKVRLLSFDTAYHGDTLGAVGVGYVRTFHGSLANNIVTALRVRPPHYFRFYEGESFQIAEEKSLAELKSLLSVHAGEIAAMIVEPLVQGAAGMWVHSEEYLRSVVGLLRQNDIFFIADEVATGFAKTGSLFAVQRAGVSPDIMIVAKGLSGGYLPISAALATDQIYEGFIGAPEEFKTFFYGQTFAGNPLAASVSLENLKLIQSSRLLERLTLTIPEFHRALDEHIAGLPQVDEVRRLGMMVGIELTKNPGKRDPYLVQDMAGLKITRKARELGAVIRPLGNVMVLMPPVAMGREDLIRLVEITAEAITSALSREELTKSLGKL